MRLALFFAAIVVVIGSMFTPLADRGRAAAQTPAPAATMRVAGPGASVTTSTKQFDVSVDVANVTNLAGFQFVLAYDPHVVQALSAAKTQFLATTGREIVCGQPTIDAGAIRVACVTLRLQPAGVDGSGTVATVTFKPLTRGTTDLVLKNVKLVHPDGTELASSAVSGRVSVSGTGGWTMSRTLLVAGGAGVLLILLATVLAVRARAKRRATAAIGTGPSGDA